LKFAKMRGQQVVVIDHHRQKEKAAMDMGAQYFLDNSDPSAFHMSECQNKIDLLLVTVENIDIKSFLPLMRKNGTICFLSASNTDVSLPVWPELIYKELKVTGSFLAGRLKTRQMIQAAAKNHVGAEIQLYPLDKCNDAINDLVNERRPFSHVIEIKREEWVAGGR